MKKFMRIALVFALAGATLVGCTKDYSGDISDLNKKVAEQQSAVTALQNAVSNAQTAADNALANAQNALKEAQEAAKAAAAANNDAEVAALTAKVATIEGEIADLEAKVKALDGLEAKLNEVAEQLKKDVDAKVDAALEEVRAELEEALALVEGNFNVTAVGATATYAYAKWDPQTDKLHKGYFDKLAKEFPELAEIKKGDEISMFGALPFIVNPSTVELDETYKFALVGKDGEDTGIVLGNPTVGYAVKAGATVWNVEVQSPAFDDKGKAVYGQFPDLALVIENANGISAQTSFEYAVNAYKNEGKHFTLGTPKSPKIQYHGTYFEGNTIDLRDLAVLDTKDEWEWSGNWWAPWRISESAPLYDNYFIIEAIDDAEVEEFGVKVEGTKVTIDYGPEAGDEDAEINFAVTAIGVNGQTDKATFKLTVEPARIKANAELPDKIITLAKDKNYVIYPVAEEKFTALEWRTIYTALAAKTNAVELTNLETNVRYPLGLTFFDNKNSKVTVQKNSDGTITPVYSKVAAFGFEIDPANVPAGNYSVEITDNVVFCGKGVLEIKNPEAHAIKLIPAFCDENGVLQVVGTPGTPGTPGAQFITYELADAFVTAISGVEVPSPLAFTDVDAEYPEDSWVFGGTTLKVYKNSDDHHDLYTVRNFSVKYPLFGNQNNKVSLDFQAEVISPIYDAEGKSIAVTDPTIYVNEDEEAKKFSSVEVKDFVGKGTFVAGFEYKGLPFNIYNVWTTTPEGGSDPVYIYWENEGNYVVPPFNLSGHRKAFDKYGAYLDDDWSDWLVSTKDGLRIEIAKEDVTIKNLIALGFSATGADTFYYEKYGTDDFPALYLTGIMFKKLQAVYAKYYDVKGNKIGAETKDGKFCYWATAQALGITTSKEAWIAGVKSDNLANLFSGDAEKQTKVQTYIEEDKAAVTLFQKYQNKFGKIDEPAVKPTDVPTVKKEDERSELLTGVKVALSETGNTFIDQPKLENPYETNEPSTFALKSDAGSHLSGDSVVIPGQVTVTDAWGMVTTKAFNLTIKTK